VRRNGTTPPRAGAAAALLVALLFVVAGCGGNGEEASPTQAPQATTEPAQSPTGVQTPPQPPQPSPPAPVRVAVTVRDGAPAGGIRRVSVDRGGQVVLVVRADVRDHVHLHGYDLLTDVAPGSPGRIRFTADMPGRFEVELEESGLHIAEVTVRG
jgi:hypothetical protein